MNICCIIHESFEYPGCISNWICERGHQLTAIHTWLDEPYPTEFIPDMLIVMGGTASVYETKKHPWLIREKKFISGILEKNKKVLAICLGAQILADVLGSRVYKSIKKEIGWFPVYYNKKELSGLDFLPESGMVFHWHGDTYDLPSGAIRIASSVITENQGFIYNRNIIALQFHLEMTQQSLNQIIESCGMELVAKKGEVQIGEEIISGIEYLDDTNRLMYRILDYLENSY